MELKEYIQKLKLYLFDMDGTLYLGDRLFDFTIELLDTIRKTGGTYLFMTNNSSKSVNDYVKKLDKLGIKATKEDFRGGNCHWLFCLFVVRVYAGGV